MDLFLMSRDGEAPAQDGWKRHEREMVALFEKVCQAMTSGDTSGSCEQTILCAKALNVRH